MSSKKSRNAWGDGLLDDAWEWAADIGTVSGLGVQVSLYPTRRRGVWRITVRALEMVDGKPAGIRAQHSVEWPDASFTGFGGAVLQACSHLALRLEEGDGLLKSPAD